MEKDRIAHLAYGAMLVLCGYLFIYELKFVSFLMGLMMLGFAVDPRGVRDDLRPMKAEAPAEKPKKAPAKRKRK